MQDIEYVALAELRFQIREFLVFSRQAARRAGLEPSQHQALLVLKGLPPTEKPTIRNVARRLLVRHHSAVGLVDRLEKSGLICRNRSEDDAREIHLTITPAGESILRKLSLAHRDELRAAAPQLVRSLRRLVSDRSTDEV